MLGTLTIDKASMNISYFLYSVLIVSNNGGKISRKDFISKMAEFVGLESQKEGKENRTPYNKSKLPRYFGLLDIENSNDESFVLLTNRGRRVVDLIISDESLENDKKYFIDPEKHLKFVEIITESIVFDSFGRYNCGAEQSNTDVEAPKILFKLIIDFEKITSEEFCYAIYGLNTGLFKSYEEVVEKIEFNRGIDKYDYKNELTELNAFNIASDCKLINIFKHPSFGFLKCIKDDEIKKNFYYFDSSLPDSVIEMFKKLNYFYKPTRMTFKFDKKQNTFQWINQTILGRNSSPKFVFHLDDASKSVDQIEDALVLAYSNEKKNVYITFEFENNKEINNLFGKYGKLINVIEDISNFYNGWSKESITDNAMYEKIIKTSKSIKKLLNVNEIKFPANIQLIGVCK